MRDEAECYEDEFQKSVSSEERTVVIDVLLTIRGMGCPNCAKRIRNSLLRLTGVIGAEVDHLSGLALVRFNPTIVRQDQLTLAVEAAGGDGRHEYAAKFLL
ncbi:MAG: hypothetical protein GTO14_09010 [Anaerolineales bacterium]|nr:hypothetical protein [Anaerolineales bacterium]